jgi:hypothetical protein
MGIDGDYTTIFHTKAGSAEWWAAYFNIPSQMTHNFTIR